MQAQASGIRKTRIPPVIIMHFGRGEKAKGVFIENGIVGLQGHGFVLAQTWILALLAVPLRLWSSIIKLVMALVLIP